MAHKSGPWTMFGGWCDEADEFENQRLISAAPLLLEALKSAIQTSEFERHPHRGWQDEARAAIRAAEGENATPNVAFDTPPVAAEGE